MKRRELLVELGLEESIVFENPDYDSAIIGYDENSGRVIYDYELMIEDLMDTDDMTYEDAMEFVDYNTVRACPYMGDRAPIIMAGIADYMDYADTFKQSNNQSNEKEN